MVQRLTKLHMILNRDSRKAEEYNWNWNIDFSTINCVIAHFNFNKHFAHRFEINSFIF